MNNQEFITCFEAKVAEERRITNEILLMIIEAEDRRVYLLRGFSGVHDWLTSLGYSESAAYRRMQAASQIRVVPEVVEKLQTGRLNLTTVTQARTAMRAHQKKSGRKLNSDEQRDLLAQIENKSSKETNRKLAELLSLNENLEKLVLQLTPEAMADLAWAKDFFSHSIPDGDASTIFARLLKELRENAAAAKPRVSVRKLTLLRANRKCEYRDPQTGRVCGSTYQVQVDHIVPKARGGSNELENLRCLCAAHNRFAAEQALGRERANRWRKTNENSSSP